MMRQLRENDPKGAQVFNTFLARTCQALFSGNQPRPLEFSTEFRAAVDYFVSGDWNPAAKQFIFNLIPSERSTDGARGAKSAQENIFIHSCDAGSVAMRVDTIHSVKGEDLKAVLVLETIFYEHDLKVLIENGYLKGESPTRKPGKRLANHLKRIFVAMTRPMHLLCLAILDEHLKPEDRQALEKDWLGYQRNWLNEGVAFRARTVLASN